MLGYRKIIILNGGGIVAHAYEGCNVYNCINTGDINNKGYTCAGIVGRIQRVSATVKDCYNIGDITSTRESGGIVGFVNLNTGVVTVNIQNCYNTGTLVSNTNKGGVVGNYTNTSGSTFNISNNSWISGCGATYGIAKANKNTGCTKFTSSLDYTLLGDAYIADGKIKDKNGEWVDNKDVDGNIIYINGGYPILKWQIEQ